MISLMRHLYIQKLRQLAKPALRNHLVVATAGLGTMSENDEKSLKLSQKLAYGTGHFMNDVCAAIWFSYTLLFFEVVLEMPSYLAGGLIFLGQLADAFASPVIGILVDRYGTRKFWHMLGTALISSSFPLIFLKCPWDSYFSFVHLNATRDIALEETREMSNFVSTAVYYAILVVAFQAGWATIQIAHLAIIPDLTPDKSERADLTAIRYTATVCSSIFVYIVTWCILRVNEENLSSLGPKDAYKFKDVCLTGVLTGTVLTVVFHAILEVSNQDRDNSKTSPKSLATWFGVIRSYFKSWELYQVTLLYFSSRMILNISLVYMPLYLVENFGNEAELIATVPLVSYVASFLASLGIQQMKFLCSTKVYYNIGTLLSIGACVWIGLGLFCKAEIFGVSVLLGAGSSITGVASLCLCADLIGTNTENGAFIYSIVTAADKLLGGVVVILIESLKTKIYVGSSHYYQNVITYGCGVSSVLGFLTLLSMYLCSISFARKS